MAMLRPCKHSIGMLLLWAGLLQICAAQSPGAFPDHPLWYLHEAAIVPRNERILLSLNSWCCLV